MDRTAEHHPARAVVVDGLVGIADAATTRRTVMSHDLADSGVAVWSCGSLAGAAMDERLGSTRVLVIGEAVSAVDVVQAVRDVRLRAPAISILAVIDDATGEWRRAATRLVNVVDDIVRGPCIADELVLRVRALLRRTDVREHLRPWVIAPQWLLDVPGMRLIYRGESIPLAPREFGIIAMLARARGAVVSRRDLALAMSDSADQHVKSDNALEARITQLRKKLAKAGLAHHLQTVRNSGYRLSLPSPATAAHPGPTSANGAD